MKSSHQHISEKTKKFLSSLSEILVQVSSYLLMSSVLIMVALVFSRYTFKYSFPWAEELTRYIIVYMALFTCASVTHDNDHIRVNYFFDHLPSLMRYSIRLFFDICIFGTMVVWVTVGFDTAIFMKFMMSGGLGISMMWPYMAIPLSGILLGIFIIKNFIQDLTHPDRDAGKSPISE